jgi:hypothetical protein
MLGRRTSARASATRWRCPPRQLCGATPLERREAETRCRLFDASLDLGRRKLRDAQGERDVLEDVEVRVQGIALEHHRQPSLSWRLVVDDLPVQAHVTASRALEAGDQGQQRRLSAARGADDRDELALVDLEIDPPQDGPAPSVRLVHPIELDGRGRRHPFTAPAVNPLTMRR